MAHFVIYTEVCSPKIKKFRTHRQAKSWIFEFLKENQGNPDAWISIWFKGEVFFIDEAIKGELTDAERNSNPEFSYSVQKRFEG